MSLDVGFHPLAAVEIVDAEFWYEQQSEGLGDRFLGAVETTATRVSRWPNVGAPVMVADDGTIINRKIPVGGFPWVVGYEVVGDRVVVLAVFHQRRRSDYWVSRER